MRNIALSDFQSRQLIYLNDCEAFCHDRQFLYAYDKGKIIKCQADGVEVISNLTKNLYPVSEETDFPKALEIKYCCEKDLLYLILLNGDIISIPINETGGESIVGSVDCGIKAAQWSPNEEVIVLVTGNDSVIVMTQNFDPVSEVDLHGGGFGEKQFITAGWGKKETQFRGSEGKFQAKETLKEELNIPSDIKDIKISWRGDAEYFAISCINPDTTRRYLRIFSKVGILQYTSEDIQGLEHNLDWSPSGSLIATTQRLPNKYVICFFEKNGLKHGEFKLPFSFKEIKVDEVSWNKDSKILAILFTRISDEHNKTKCLQLYTVNNYHWYHKYTINFDSLSVPLLIQWDNNKHNTLHVIVKKESMIYYNKYSWLWVLNKSKVTSAKDESLVAVIDGLKLKVTSFNRGIIPPPMCTKEIHFQSFVNSVSFMQTTSSNDLMIELSSGNLLIYKFVDNSLSFDYKCVAEIQKFYNDNEMCFNVQRIDSNLFMLCMVKMEDAVSKPYLSLLSIENFDDVKYKRRDIALQSTIALLRASKSAVLIHDNAGQLYLFSKADNSLVVKSSDKKNFLDLEVKDEQNGDFNYFCLDTSSKFYINNDDVLKNVLSFHLHENFILLTTMKHELLCLNIETDGVDLTKLCSRRVERGSRIVTSIHKNSKVILQMPRGNLECVQPRALSLFVLGKYIDSLNYFSAYDLMRKDRINLNLLYDHNPGLFFKNVNLFLEQIKDFQWISLFLADLSDEDVTQTMYSGFYNKKNKGDTCPNKIDTVCELIEKALLQKENSDHYILPLLMSYIKRGKTEFLESALLILKNLKEKEQNGVELAVSFDEAFKYVLYLIDVDELYKVALGMYDFDLVLIIAGKSQKDPKEYLEFLNELNTLEPNYQKFKIDKHLKRYKKALTSLVTCSGDDVINECINFIKNHKLYKHALKLIPGNSDLYKSICLCYADELVKNRSYEEAGFMYFNAGCPKNAIEAYRKSGNWHEVLLIISELNLDENERQDLYLDLAMELSESKLFKESATVYLDYLKDVEECVRTLSKGKLFAEAYRISSLHQRIDLINKVIVPEIIEQGNLMHSHIANLSETFAKQKNRLKVVRKQKQEPTEDNEFDDLLSETNTIVTRSHATSRTSNRTYRSAKNRRKQERKLLSLKEGSPYEDLALVTSLHNIATNCISLRSEVKELNQVLLKNKKYEMAEKLQKDLEDLLKVIELSKAEIWTPDLLNSRQFYGPDSTSNEKSDMFMRSESVAPVLLNVKYATLQETDNNLKWRLEILNPEN